jgi:D-alanyl-D-alanine carboxypeptidase
MKTTLEERVKKKLLRFGRKNRICGLLVMPPLVVSMFFFHGLNYLRANCKRCYVLVMTFCLFVVYSSFSFPLFISGDGREATWELMDADSDVELAAESELTPEDMALLEDGEVLGEYQLSEDEQTYSMDDVDKYNASEILEALGDRDSSLIQDAGVNAGDAAGGELSFSKDDWRLVLINKQHSIPEDYTFTLGTITGSLQCDERILDDLLNMLQAAKNQGVNLTICSPYRSHDRQVMLFDRKITRYMKRGMSYMEAYQLASQAVTTPGNSEHEIGLSLDIVCDTYVSLDAKFGDTAAGKWLAENSCRYGFILRYPEGKEYVTGIEYEPWHFRYVGVDAAKVITEKGITLEELWEDYVE